MVNVENNSIKCIEDLEKTGITISGKGELIDRLTEIDGWQYGLVTLINYGERRNIRLEASPLSFEEVNSILVKYGINQEIATECSKKICSEPNS